MVQSLKAPVSSLSGPPSQPPKVKAGAGPAAATARRSAKAANKPFRTVMSASQGALEHSPRGAPNGLHK